MAGDSLEVKEGSAGAHQSLSMMAHATKGKLVATAHTSGRGVDVQAREWHGAKKLLAEAISPSQL
jgi:hypothetical protein